MAHLPSFDEILSAVHQHLGLKAAPGKQRFVDYEMQLDGHVQRAQRMLFDIYAALELDDRARHDATNLIEKLGGICKALELRTWTGNASQEQVLWYLLAYVHVPVWARNIAFWSFHNIEHDLPPIDAGMPGGHFWFLPDCNATTGEINLPVPKVLSWLLDLLEEPPLNKLRDAVGRPYLRKEGGDEAAIKTLRNWLKGGLPKSSEKIDAVFKDATLSFPGAFPLNTELPAEEQFESAFNFIVYRKNLNAESLAEQIPMTRERLLPIFERRASEEERHAFVRHVAIRYAPPSMSTVCQRLRVARLAQEGYQALVEFLCPDLTAEQLCNPLYNKVQQLIGLFETVYNKTIQAWHHGHTNEEQDAWFEAQFGPWDQGDLLLVILPSLDWKKRIDLLAKKLTHHFMTLDPTHALDDLIPVRNEDAGPIIGWRVRQMQMEHDEDKRLLRLQERVRSGSPWRALQAENSCWVLCQFVQDTDLTLRIRDMALERLNAVATSPAERAGTMVLELGLLLNSDAAHRSEDCRERARTLLNTAQADGEGWQQWKAPLLRFRAKHALFENRFTDAKADFDAALEACSERGYGSLRGEIARDGFATAIIQTALNRQNHESYYRNMLHFMEFSKGVPSFEDAAAECEEFFWSDLYQPYAGFESEETDAHKNFKSVLTDTFGLIEKADWAGLDRWLKKYAAPFRKHDLKDVRRNSVFMSWWKFSYEFECKLPLLRALTPPGLQSEVDKVDQHMKHRRMAIARLLEAWPEQARIADFKGQTPLMLVADSSDVELTRLLLPLSDIDAQDHLGRTALHSAVTGRSAVCLALVLSQNPNVLKVSKGEENTAAHTAVRFGWQEGVRLILEEFPSLAEERNAEGQTPLEMARDIAKHYDEWRDVMMSVQNRHISSKKDFENTLSLLEENAIH